MLSAESIPGGAVHARVSCFGYERDDFDGETDEEEAGDTTASAVRFTRVVPKDGPAVCIGCVGDVHRHHLDAFVQSGDERLTLVEWVEREAPAVLDILAFVGDLGLEQNEELPREGARGVDLIATGARETPRHKEEATLDSWRGMLRAVLELRPNMHVVIIAGNHDGLLCHDDECLCCERLRRVRAQLGLSIERATAVAATAATATAAVAVRLAPRLHPPNGAWGDTRADAADAAAARLLEGLPFGRAHWLRDAAVDLELAGDRRVRLVGSPWTPRTRVSVEQAFDCHCSRDAADVRFWEAHWGRVSGLLHRQPAIPTVLLTHGPPRGILDYVRSGPAGQDKRIGDSSLLDLLRAASGTGVPLLHCFGHVHAAQWKGEPDAGPRFAASRLVANCLFANCAVERTLPGLTGLRLARKPAKIPRLEHKPSGESHMRNPTVVWVPLRGWDSTVWRRRGE